ncbi:MAG TPA: DUF1707 domain-containing protein [Solirubrobacteraceae bacterium]|jgi:hypothetical protein
MPSLRASDDDRRRTIEALREHHLAGRLDIDEFEERVAHAEQAETQTGLAVLLEDLEPGEVVPAGTEVSLGVPRMPGNREFTERKVLDERVLDVNERILDVVAPQLEKAGYTIAEQHPGAYVFVNRYRPAWAWWVAVLTFPIGLLALLQWYEDRITIRTRPLPDGRTFLLAHGRAPRAIRRAFAEIDR